MNIETVYLYSGIFGLIILGAKLTLSIFGADHHSADFDSSSSDFGIISLQTVSVYIAGAGWMGYILTQKTGWDSVQNGLAAGLAGLLLAAFEMFLIYKMKGLNQINEFNLEEAVGKTGIVYLTVPENGTGEVQVSFFGSMKNRKAVSENGEKIESFEKIIVTGIDNDVLIVKKHFSGE
ncbi:MAG TPA: hypothetical protein PK683_03995 [Leptospiraceae bacterium]|nr:hypothetical protein [Leptospiraceae bacterium]HNF26953.1 hypothetical protein [Leptospiraceae bacterium]HNH07638.1 hypothetical protein [Leptospiraceae bacterium]HNI98671.1 hypothetical protein [Leptospiraceae bacterium]HNM06111.1 hypothetical protein [Leptospiraceae bacterium]